MFIFRETMLRGKSINVDKSQLTNYENGIFQHSIGPVSNSSVPTANSSLRGSLGTNQSQSITNYKIIVVKLCF